MKKLEFPRFKKLSHSEFAGAPILRRIWDFFDVSLLLSQSGIRKDRGVPTWILSFVYILGLIAQKSSVLQTASMAMKDALLGPMFMGHKITQYTLSRFFTNAAYDWSLFGSKRFARLQQEKQTRLKDGDHINLDDTLVAHPYAKKIPFLSWLFDHSQKVYYWGMNLVVVQAVLSNGIEYPVSYAIWHKPIDGEPAKTKLDLAREMLFQIRRSVSVSIPDIYMKLPSWVPSKRGSKRLVKKQKYIAIAAVVAMRLKEDEATEKGGNPDSDTVALFRGAYLIISNRKDAPKAALEAYVKRWRIEVFFRTAKQELRLQQCHSTTEAHHHAHLQLLFTAETLLNYALLELNKEKTSDEGYTHGEMVRGLFHTRCQIRLTNRKGNQRIYIDCDTEAQRFARLIQLFWPKDIRMQLIQTEDLQFCPSTA